MLTLDSNLMRQIIMEHYKKPMYKKNISKNNKNYLLVNMKSVNCIDNINLFLKTEKNNITECWWNGTACTISAASTDILCGLVIKRSKKEAKTIINEYIKMLKNQKFNKKILKEAIVFSNVYKQAARIKCAMIGCQALQKIIDLQ